MRFFWTIVLLINMLPVAAQNQLKGTWQGLMIRDGQSLDQAVIVYFDFTGDGDFIGKSREEVTGKDAFIVKKLKGTKQAKTVQLKQFVADKKKEIPGVKWCNIEATLTFIDSTGYLEGTYKSTECRGYSGKIICYRSTLPLSYEPTVKEVQSWRPIFVDDLKKGRKAPEIRDLERKNFRFQPIYFDHDKAEIRPEFKTFLVSMVQVVNGHSDLRIKVIGHTDADGSDAYNIDLSQRRAQAIIDFFLALGLSRDRIQIEFRGEAEPVGDNSTPEGKQLNRRVDFAFI
jgi:outer membrane protein OmpA-like peptidoglycan-associated protein